MDIVTFWLVSQSVTTGLRSQSVTASHRSHFVTTAPPLPIDHRGLGVGGRCRRFGARGGGKASDAGGEDEPGARIERPEGDGRPWGESAASPPPSTGARHCALTQTCPAAHAGEQAVGSDSDGEHAAKAARIKTAKR